MTTRNGNVRFLQNNRAAATTAVVTASSALSGFPVSNAFTTRRDQRYITAGSFKVTSSNNLIYIGDGSNRTVTLTAATYGTGALLAAHVQTRLNASSSNWTCSYSSTTGKFTVGRSSGTATLRLTQTTNAAWSMLGYTGTLDTSAGTALAADERRNHTSEIISVDMGSAVSCPAFALFGPAGSLLSLSATATVQIRGNNISPPGTGAVNLAAAVEADGCYLMLDDQASTTYRYWEIEITDQLNPLGPNFEFSYIYLGDYVSPTTRNVNSGFEHRTVDPSEAFISSSGAAWYKKKSKYLELSGVKIDYLVGTDRTDLKAVYDGQGQTDPFIVCLDPLVQFSARLGEFTKFVRFAADPGFAHERYNIFDVSFDFREVV